MKTASEFVNEKLGDKNYTHSPYPMHREEIIAWLKEFASLNPESVREVLKNHRYDCDFSKLNNGIYKMIDASDSDITKLISDLCSGSQEKEQPKELKCDELCKWWEIGYGHCNYCLRCNRKPIGSGYNDNYEKQ